MKIVIVGGGKVGEVLCSELTNDENDVILIERNENALDRLTNKFDINGIAGNGVDYAVLEEAQVATADIFIAVTELDEINIISSILAKKMGAKYTIARVRNPEYSDQINKVRHSLGISLLINPEKAAAADIYRVLQYTSALSVDSFVEGRVNLVELEIDNSSSLINLSLKEIRMRFNSIIICVIHRNDDIFIPTGDSVLRENDRIFVTGKASDLSKFFKMIAYNQKQIDSALIVGASKITYYLLQSLNKVKLDVKVIEKDPSRCEQFSSIFPNVKIINGDGTDQDILDEQEIEEYDSFISLTGVDEENLIMSVYARHKGVKKIITKMNRVGILKILQNIKVRTIITPKQIVAEEIIQFVRARTNTAGSNIEALYRIADSQVEALQFKVNEGTKVLNVPLAKLNLKPNVLIMYILRNNNLIFPNGNDVIKANDRVILVTTEKNFNDLEDILRK